MSNNINSLPFLLLYFIEVTAYLNWENNFHRLVNMSSHILSNFPSDHYLCNKACF